MWPRIHEVFIGNSNGTKAFTCTFLNRHGISDYGFGMTISDGFRIDPGKYFLLLKQVISKIQGITITWNLLEHLNT